MDRAHQTVVEKRAAIARGWNESGKGGREMEATSLPPIFHSHKFVIRRK